MPTHISIFTRKSNSLLLAAAALSLTMAASCELPPSDGGIGFEYTGRVLYKDTKEPIEGAYVLAVYEKVDVGWAGASRNCIKTKGMTTGKDGKFNFPIDKLDGNSPSLVVAIKPDHFFEGFRAVSDKSWKKQNKETYSNRDVYLLKQNPAKPSFQHGFSYCERPLSSEAVESAVVFLEMKLVEGRKYFPQSDNRSVKSFIERMKNPNERVN